MAGAELSSSDVKELARLVSKYGREVIAAAADTVELPRRGRPSRKFQSYLERMHLADWIEEQAEEHRQAGNPNPYKQAEIDLYILQYDGQEHLRDVNKFRKTIKKYRLQGRRELQEKLRVLEEWKRLLQERMGRK